MRMPLSAPLKDGATEERGEGTDLRELTGLDTDRESSNVGVPFGMVGRPRIRVHDERK
jgi:hypothetical protein